MSDQRICMVVGDTGGGCPGTCGPQRQTVTAIKAMMVLIMVRTRTGSRQSVDDCGPLGLVENRSAVVAVDPRAAGQLADALKRALLGHGSRDVNALADSSFADGPAEVGAVASGQGADLGGGVGLVSLFGDGDDVGVKQERGGGHWAGSGGLFQYGLAVP